MNVYVAYGYELDSSALVFGVTTSIDAAKALCQADATTRYGYHDDPLLRWREPLTAVAPYTEHDVAHACLGSMDYAVARFAVGVKE